MKFIAKSQEEFEAYCKAFEYLHDFYVETKHFEFRFWMWFWYDEGINFSIWNYHRECLDFDIPEINDLCHMYLAEPGRCGDDAWEAALQADFYVEK
jgi:hypothetical protein